MDWKKLGLGLGVLPIGIAAVELLSPRTVTGALGVEGREGVVRAFGAREAMAGAALLAAPAVSTNVWMRVAGDAMDLGALALAGRGGNRGPAFWSIAAFVLAATALDILTASGLDRQTGKFLPTRA